MSDCAADENITSVSSTQALRIWWATTWRYVLISMGVGFALTLVLGLVGTGMGEALPAIPEDSHLVRFVATAVSAVMLMFAMRQALLADFGTFSLTVMEQGSTELGRIHDALGIGRMARIWWAAAWPLHLFGQGVNYLAPRLGLPAGPEAEVGVDMAGCLGVLLLSVLIVILSVACLWRAVRKRYRGFRLVALLPWSAQRHP